MRKTKPATASHDARDAVHLKDARGLKVDKQDLDEFRAAVSAAFDQLAGAYYLNSDVTPEIKVRKDRIDVSIPLSREQ